MSEHKCCGGHNHDEHHNCCGGHGHDHDHEHIEYQTMDLVLDDGSEITCLVLSIFEVNGVDGQFVALLPEPEGEDYDENEETPIYLYGYKDLEDGEVELINIDSDEEYDKVAAAFDEIMIEEED